MKPDFWRQLSVMTSARDRPGGKAAFIQDRTASVDSLLSSSASLGGSGAVADKIEPIDNKIEQAMDLVKSHLLLAVREEVDVLKASITKLVEKISVLERENEVLKANATPEVLAQLDTQPSQAPSPTPTPAPPPAVLQQQQQTLPQQQQQQLPLPPPPASGP